MKRAFLTLLLALLLAGPAAADKDLVGALSKDMTAGLKTLLERHPGKTGAFVMERGEESLLARAWIAERVQKSIDVQTFIWSTDNIGKLSLAAALQAAERGVRIRLLVDDFGVETDHSLLLALNDHPNIHIRLYNPAAKRMRRRPVGALFNLPKTLRALNQRMHNKTFIADSHIGITGGRNMADEYFDYNHTYNFRDRDVIVLGPAAKEMQSSFDQFWKHETAAPVEGLYAKELKKLKTEELEALRAELLSYGNDPSNFRPEVRKALAELPKRFDYFLEHMSWCHAEFHADEPGKNDGAKGLEGGGHSGKNLLKLLRGAKERVVIQSPYLVLPKEAFEIFRELRERGVKIRISTNSLASTDNIHAFSGYRRQRKDILKMGIEVFEYKARPGVQRELIDRYDSIQKNVPVFAIHAKTLVVDGRWLFVGTFNLDPRSTHLNTEDGIFIDDEALAEQTESFIEIDMKPENALDARQSPDRASRFGKRFKARFWSLIPLEPLL